MTLHLCVGGQVPTHGGQVAATTHVRHDVFGYDCVLASVETNAAGQQTLWLGHLTQEGPLEWKMYFLLWFSPAHS